MKERSVTTVLSRKRESQVNDGLYDGRFMTRVIEDKKKRDSRMKCRKFSKTDLFKA